MQALCEAVRYMEEIVIGEGEPSKVSGIPTGAPYPGTRHGNARRLERPKLGLRHTFRPHL
jgi:hypothetical protein